MCQYQTSGMHECPWDRQILSPPKTPPYADASAQPERAADRISFLSLSLPPLFSIHNPTVIQSPPASSPSHHVDLHPLLLLAPPPSPPLSQNSHTYQNTKHTAPKNPSHTFHPTPVFSAIRSMRFIVPRSRTRVLSKESFIFSAKWEESRISSPMATVSYVRGNRM